MCVAQAWSSRRFTGVGVRWGVGCPDEQKTTSRQSLHKMTTRYTYYPLTLVTHVRTSALENVVRGTPKPRLCLFNNLIKIRLIEPRDIQFGFSQ